MGITDEDRRYFASLRVIARLLAVAKVAAWWPGTSAGIPDDEREILDHARALVDGYNAKGERKEVC